MLHSRRGAAAGGATLIELVVALVLLAIVLLSAVGLLGRGTAAIDAAGRRSQALAVTDGLLEVLAAEAFAALVETAGCDPEATDCLCDPTSPVVAEGRALAAGSLPGAELEARLESVGGPTLASAPAVRVVVRLSWSEGLRRRVVALATLRI